MHFLGRMPLLQIPLHSGYKVGEDTSERLGDDELLLGIRRFSLRQTMHPRMHQGQTKESDSQVSGA